MVELRDITAARIAGLAVIRHEGEAIAIAFARAEAAEGGDARSPTHLTWMKGKKGKVWAGSEESSRVSTFLEGVDHVISLDDVSEFDIPQILPGVELIPAAKAGMMPESLESQQGRERDNLLSRQVALTSATTGGSVPIGALQVIVEGGKVEGLGAMRGFEAGQRILNVAKADASGLVDSIRHLKRGAAGGRRAAGRRGTARAYKRDEERSR